MCGRVGGGVIGACARVLPREGRATASRCSIAAGSAAGVLARQLRVRLPEPRPAARRARGGVVHAQDALPPQLAAQGPAGALCSRNLGWFLGFARRCNDRDMLAAGRGHPGAARTRRGRCSTTCSRDERLDCEWETKGLLFVFRSPKRVRPLRPHRRTAARREFACRPSGSTRPSLRRWSRR